jgi:hypothetical protein
MWYVELDGNLFKGTSANLLHPSNILRSSIFANLSIKYKRILFICSWISVQALVYVTQQIGQFVAASLYCNGALLTALGF